MITTVSSSSASAGTRAASGEGTSHSAMSSLHGDSTDTIAYSETAQSRPRCFTGNLPAPLIAEINVMLDRKVGSRKIAAAVSKTRQKTGEEIINIGRSQVDSIFYQGLGRPHRLTQHMPMPQAIADKLAEYNERGFKVRKMTRLVNPIETRQALFVTRSAIEMYCQQKFGLCTYAQRMKRTVKIKKRPVKHRAAKRPPAFISADIFEKIDGIGHRISPALNVPEDAVTLAQLMRSEFPGDVTALQLQPA